MNPWGVALLARIKRCGLSGVGVALLGLVPLELDFEVSKANARPSISLFPMPVDPGV